MDFNSDQFRQPGPGQGAFRGYGDQAMRRYRELPPRVQREPAQQQSAAPSGWIQPELPDPSAAPAGPARLTPAAQARADISAARAQARAARVAIAQANARAATHRQTLAENRAAQLGQRAADTTRPAPAPPDPSAVPDLTPPGPPAGPSGPGRPVTINMRTYRAQSQGPQRSAPSAAPAPQPAPSAPPPSSPPSRLNTPPGAPWVQARSQSAVTAAARGGAITRATPSPAARTTPVISPGVARAGKALGVGTFVAAKALQSISKPATDPKRSGNPLYKSSQGWMR